MRKMISLGPENLFDGVSGSISSFGCVFLVAQDGFILGAEAFDVELAHVAGRSYSGGGGFYGFSLNNLPPM
jgi:hypothetical protein